MGSPAYRFPRRKHPDAHPPGFTIKPSPYSFLISEMLREEQSTPCLKIAPFLSHSWHKICGEGAVTVPIPMTSPEDPGGPLEVKGGIWEESIIYHRNCSPREQQKKPGKRKIGILPGDPREQGREKGYPFLLCPDSSTARSPAIPSAATDIPPGRGDFCVRVGMGV